MRKPVDYKQYDSRWANVMYNCPGNANDTIKIAGCGPTCTAMIVASLKDSKVTPVMLVRGHSHTATELSAVPQMLTLWLI